MTGSSWISGALASAAVGGGAVVLLHPGRSAAGIVAVVVGSASPRSGDSTTRYLESPSWSPDLVRPCRSVPITGTSVEQQGQGEGLLRDIEAIGRLAVPLLIAGVVILGAGSYLVIMTPEGTGVSTPAGLLYIAGLLIGLLGVVAGVVALERGRKTQRGSRSSAGDFRPLE
jgi:hypothetical protein